MRRAKPSCPRGFRKKNKEYVLERFREEDPDSYFKYKSHGLTQDQLVFVEGIEKHRLNDVRSLLDRGFDPNYTILPERKTPLHVSVTVHIRDDKTTEKVVRSLLYFGSDPNVQDCCGYTPLHIACHSSFQSCIEALVQAGADVNLKTCSQETPLMLLCASGNPTADMVKFLIDNGADIHRLNEKKQNGLHLFCKKQNGDLFDWERRPKIVEMLLDNGVCTTCVDSFGKTPVGYELHRLATLLIYNNAVDDNPSIFPDAAKVALALIRGGGMQDFDVHRKDLATIIGTLHMFRWPRPFLTNFFTSIQNVLSIADYDIICRWMAVPQDAFNLTQGFSIEYRLRPNVLDPPREEEDHSVSADSRYYKDVARSGPPSLLNSTKNVIRRRLGGTLTLTVSYLGLPGKMASYVKSL